MLGRGRLARGRLSHPVRRPRFLIGICQARPLHYKQPLNGTPAVHDHNPVGAKLHPGATSVHSPCRCTTTSGVPLTSESTAGPLGIVRTFSPSAGTVTNKVPQLGSPQFVYPPNTQPSGGGGALIPSAIRWSGHAQPSTVLNDASTLPQGDGDARPAFAGGVEGSKRNIIVLNAGDVFNDAFAVRGPGIDAVGEVSSRCSSSRPRCGGEGFGCGNNNLQTDTPPSSPQNKRKQLRFAPAPDV